MLGSTLASTFTVLTPFTSLTNFSAFSSSCWELAIPLMVISPCWFSTTSLLPGIPTCNLLLTKAFISPSVFVATVLFVPVLSLVLLLITEIGVSLTVDLMILPVVFVVSDACFAGTWLAPLVFVELLGSQNYQLIKSRSLIGKTLFSFLSPNGIIEAIDLPVCRVEEQILNKH